MLFDPWLTGNPVAPLAVDELEAAELLLLTHDHFDHASDVVRVVERTGATLVAQPETAARYREAGVPQERIVNGIGMNIGGTVRVAGLAITMTDAYHTSETGEPAGYIVTLEDGKVLYHTGDTCLHTNMSTWGELFDIDVALVPIGDVFTMDARQAARALRWIKPKQALPMHYLTFPALAQSADEFVRLARECAPDVAVHVLEPGGTHTF